MYGDLSTYRMSAFCCPTLSAVDPTSTHTYFGSSGIVYVSAAEFHAHRKTKAAGIDLKENLAAGGAPWPYPSVYHPYDAAFGYPFNSTHGHTKHVFSRVSAQPNKSATFGKQALSTLKTQSSKS
uniref:Uncharacterized protein n=1 Tax=Anopheles maculatus TaxID=74869 RepID=A0A182SUM0_9DIPT